MNSKALPPYGQEDVEILETSLCHQGHLRVERLLLRCRLYEGGWSKPFYREVLKREAGVGVLLYDPVRDMVLLAEQFRVGCLEDRHNGPWALELVAGLVETGESPREVAIRETSEEAGLTITNVLPVTEYYNSPGGSSEKLTIFCAAFDARHETGVFGLDNEAENIRTCIISREEALAAISTGRINNAMSIIALQWLQLNLSDVRERLSGIN